MAGNVRNQVNEAQNGIEASNVPNPNESNNQGEKILVERGRLDSPMVYDVMESELALLEKTSDASVWLNFFIGTVSVAISFLISLLTVNWGSQQILKIIFICVVIIMGLASLICLVFWLRRRCERNETITTIRNRPNLIDIATIDGAFVKTMDNPMSGEPETMMYDWIHDRYFMNKQTATDLFWQVQLKQINP